MNIATCARHCQAGGEMKCHHVIIVIVRCAAHLTFNSELDPRHVQNDAPPCACTLALAPRLFCISTPSRTQRPHLQPPPHHLHRRAHPRTARITRQLASLLSPRVHRFGAARPYARAAAQAFPRTARRVQSQLLDRRTSR